MTTIPVRLSSFTLDLTMRPHLVVPGLRASVRPSLRRPLARRPPQSRPLSLEALNPVSALAELFLASPLPFGATIVLLTLALRGGISLPFTLWQRRRVDKTREIIVPEMKALNDRLAFELMVQGKKSKWSYERYYNELKARMKDGTFALHKKHGTHPLITFLAPLAVNVPILIVTSLAIRHALEVPGSPLAAESFAWIKHLGEPDQTGAIGLIASGIAFTNAELSGRKIKSIEEEDREASAPDVPKESEKEAEVAPASPVASAPIAAAAATQTTVPPAPRRVRAEPKSSAAPWEKRQLSTTAVARALPPRRRSARVEPARKAPPAPPVLQEVTPGQGAKAQLQASAMQRGMSAAMRIGAVALVPFAMLVPSAVAIYWTTSLTFTLAQQTYFTTIDRAARRKRAEDRAARRRAKAELGGR